jgi:hypothetical protein
MNNELITEIKFPTFKEIYKQIEIIDQNIEEEALKRFNFDDYSVKYYETRAITNKVGEGQYDPMYDFKDLLLTAATDRDQLLRKLYLKANLIYSTKINTCSREEDKNKIADEFLDLYFIINNKRLKINNFINKIKQY